ncbi:MAG TPA: hypothetical protein VMZ31_05445 [Phycisphaerae bacterium]|nr:hypothetical protein [Phycisphaerae bacterium]
MKASAISGLQRQMSPVVAGKAIGRQAHAGSHPDGPQGVARGQQAAAGNEQDTATDPVVENPTERAKGVLRLLQEGHFRGVADVRLRINFHDELMALQNDAVKSVAPDNLQSISDVINAQVDALIESGSLTEEQQAAVDELRQTFSDTVQQLTDEFLNADGLQSDALAAGLQDAFDAFLESLTSLLLPEEPPAPPVNNQPDVEPPVDETADEDPDVPSDGSPQPAPTEGSSEPAPAPLSVEVPTDDPVGESPGVPPDSTPEPTPPQDPQGPGAGVFDVEAFLGGLSASFDAALTELVEAMHTTRVLPELSPPNGNGKAYAKFLAMYHELWGLEHPSETPPAESLDTMA